MTGLAGGAEMVIIPEVPTKPDQVAAAFKDAYERGKTHALAVVAEGSEYNAAVLDMFFRENRERLGFEVRTTTLGHVQRGGTPGAFDRILATRLGAAAVDALLAGHAGHLVGWTKGEISLAPYSEIAGKTKSPDTSLLELIQRLAV
jgi:6-phosphofructokinase 1